MVTKGERNRRGMVINKRGGVITKGVWDEQIQIIIHKIDKQQGFSV